jgi:dynein heavy chain
VDDLVLRLQFVDKWLKGGSPAAFWISGFFFPQGFMTGVLQTHSRRYKIAIDTLVFRTEVLDRSADALHEPPKNGVYIYGVFLEGARWDQKACEIAESKPGELFNSMPAIWLDPIVAADRVLKDVYTCPLYKTSRRAGVLSTTGHSTNFVVALHLRSKLSEDHWIRRGVAMLAALDS